MKMRSRNGLIAERVSARSNGSSSSTPMAAPAADQPTTPSAPLALLSPTLPAPYPPAHTSDTTSTSRL